MKKATFIIILFLQLFNFSLSQQELSKFSLTAFGLPVVANLNNINNEYTLISNHQANVFNNASISNEFGMHLAYQLTEKISVGVGMSYKNYNYDVDVLFDTWDDVGILDRRAGSKHENSIRIKALGYRGLINFMISEKLNTSVSLIVEFNKPLSFDLANPLITNGNHNDYSLSEFVSANRFNMDHYIVPEIHFSTEIAHNIAVSYGMKLKFWGKEDLYLLQIKEKAYPSQPVFDYRIDSRQIAMFVGLNYTFQFPKLRKSKVELIKIKKLQ